MTERTVRLRIEGRVQGVWYRGWTVKEAALRGLRGWVRNRVDGSVEALLSGPAPAVAAMIEACHNGPPAAHVRQVAVEETSEAPPQGFEQRTTA